MKRSRSLVLALLSVLALQGCGVKLAYNNLHRVVPWYVGSYIDLTPEQRRYLKLRVKKHMHWNRNTQLNRYAATLEGAARAVEVGLDAENLEDIIDEVKVHRDAMLDEILPTAAVLFISSSDEQLLEFAMRLDEANEERLEEESGDIEELRAAWEKDVQKSVKDLVGRLTPQQKLFIEERSREVRFEPEAQVGFRRNWEGDFLRALAKRDDPVWFSERLAHMAHDYEEWYTDAYRIVEKREDEFYRGLAVSMTALLTPMQKRKLMRWFLDLAQDLRELAADADVRPPKACVLEAALEDMCALHQRVFGPPSL
ncbi:MAG: DUF6279 family lipoprotein [Pseudomonadales bacterium]